MNQATTQALSEIAGNTNNDVILFVIVMLFGLVVAVPSLVVYLKTKSADKHMRHKEQMEREAEARKREETLLNVVQGNTAAMVKLTTLLESNNQNCTECRAEQSALNRDILEKAEAIHLDIIKFKEKL